MDQTGEVVVTITAVATTTTLAVTTEIREEFRTSSRPSDSGGNPHRSLFILGLNALISKSPVHLRRRQLPWTRRIGFLTWRRSLMSWVRFLRLAGFLKAAAGTEEEQEKNFQWGLRKSTLNHLMCMSFTDVAQVANAARNYEILHERDDDDAERPDKRRVVIGISRPLNRVVTGTTVTIMTVIDQTGEAVVTITASATTTTLATTTGISIMGVTRETGVSSPTDLSILSRGPSEGYSYPVCTTCGRRHPGECRRAAGTCFKCGQAGHLQKNCKKNTTASTYGQADKKPGASGCVFAITEDHATKTSG
nr:hypothetical protein [Tanacetum cinerariifolium]